MVVWACLCVGSASENFLLKMRYINSLFDWLIDWGLGLGLEPLVLALRPWPWPWGPWSRPWSRVLALRACSWPWGLGLGLGCKILALTTSLVAGWPLVWKIWKCQGIWQLSGILLKVRGKILSGKSRLKLFIVSCIFASVQAFSRSLFCVKY